MFWFKKKIDEVIVKPQFAFKTIFNFSQREGKRKLIDQKFKGERSDGISYLVIQKASSSKLTSFKKPYKLFAVESKMKVIDLIAYIRNNLSLTEKLSLFMIIGKTIANTNYTIGELYQIYSEPDGFLYIVISESESF